MANSTKLDCSNWIALGECVDCEDGCWVRTRLLKTQLKPATSILRGLHVHRELPAAVTDLLKIFPVFRHWIRQFPLPGTPAPQSKAWGITCRESLSGVTAFYSEDGGHLGPDVVRARLDEAHEFLWRSSVLEAALQCVGHFLKGAQLVPKLNKSDTVCE